MSCLCSRRVLESTIIYTCITIASYIAGGKIKCTITIPTSDYNNRSIGFMYQSIHIAESEQSNSMSIALQVAKII